MRVVCAGHVNWDVTLRVDRLPVADDEARVLERSEAGGGSAANVAANLAALSRHARLLGSVGDDDAGRRTIADLDAVGVESQVRVVDGAATTTKYVLVDDDGEVAVLGTDGANESLAPEDVTPAVFDDADALHLTGYRPETASRLAELADDRDIPISFDPGRRFPDRPYDDVLERTDLLFVTEREAETVESGATWQVTKRGPDGARLSCPGGTFEHEGYALPSVDSTGAGDAFAAGFLAVWLDDGDPERALAVANACGALAASDRGPKTDLSWERVEELSG